MKILRTVGFLIQFGLIGLGVAALYILLWGDADQLLSKTPSTPPLSVAAFDAGPGPVRSYADAVERSAASVVTIYTTKTVNRQRHPLLDDPVFQEFFGEQLQRRRDETQTSLGSGVILSHDGYIITNQHVIDGADEILVALPDGRGSQARLVGEDRETDLAVLHIPIDGLSPIGIASDGNLRVGDVVLAIGNPLNVGQTVTMGIISATGRNRVGINTFENFIQTDAAINPGNSGGALVNADGGLIGINTAIFSQSGGSQGIGFAIPVSIVLDIMRQIVENGRVSRGWLGVEGQEITARAAMATGNPNIKGALIVGVFVGSPADRAGIRAGDIIVAVNREPVSGIRSLLDMITRHKPGDRIEVTLVRGKRQYEVTMRAIERP